MTLRVPSSASPDPRAELPHLADGDLIRHHDAELDPAEEARVARHLRGCPSCAARQVTLLAVAARVRAAYGAVTLPPELETPPWRLTPAARPRRSLGATRRDVRTALHGARHVAGAGARTLARVAAVIAVLAAAAAAAPSLRATLRAWRHPANADGRGSASAGPPSRPARDVSVAPDPSPPQRTATLAFLHRPSVLTIEIAAATRDSLVADSLVMRAAASDSVRVEARGRAVEPTFVLTPDALRLVSAAGGATYLLAVPPSVTLVEVRQGSHVRARVARALLRAHGEWRGALPRE